MAEATSACRPQIERLSKSPFEWTDGWFDEKFSMYRWNREKAVITFIGDKFRSQTIFGGWQFQVYTCDYDPDTKIVVGVNSVPGPSIQIDDLRIIESQLREGRRERCEARPHKLSLERERCRDGCVAIAGRASSYCRLIAPPVR